MKNQSNLITYNDSPTLFSISLRPLKLLFLIFVVGILKVGAQTTPPKGNDSTTPLHALQPDYPVPYGKLKAEDIKAVLDRVYTYLEGVTPPQIINSKTGEEIKDYKKPIKEATLKNGDFRLTSYEWGVTYAGMLNAGEATGDAKFTNYTTKRLAFLAEAAPYFRTLMKDNVDVGANMKQVLTPHALDDAGAVCAAMIKATRSGSAKTDLRPLIDNYINYISTKEFRLQDGTLARNRPQPNTIWLDDLFMAVPALAQMGKLTGDRKYFDDAVKQVLQISGRMFVKEKGLYMHGWVQGMDVHPHFHWARANGWAVMTKVELLDVLPEDHPGRQPILDLLRAHVKGLAAYQSGPGFWHQLLDRNDSYLETSATAIYTYAIAKAINKGWIDPLAYGPMVIHAWNAVSTKVNAKGHVEGTCVGTGMGFDPAFYYYRPINVYAAHGYGPVLLAGAEMLTFLKNHPYELNDSAVQALK